MKPTKASRVQRRPRHEIKVADEVWIAAALLHRENSDQADFSVAEIVERARREALTPELRPGVYVHVVLHCVANRPPNPGRYRMLFETAPNRRRLYRPGDPADEARRGAKSTPSRSGIPARYHALLDWYEREYVSHGGVRPESDPLLALRGTGRELWADEHADQYVRRLREGWQ
ncbi:MAG: hypothetical protein L0027_11365 [Candidatus Rokubacteria bacterium]|nr:hypothetical protein [Candidatus Rokubacteria bacterium]